MPRLPKTMATALPTLHFPDAPHETPSHTDRRTLSDWMARVLKELGKLRSQPDADTVHDLRVAIRRCRSVAAVMEEVDPHPVWPAMRSLARGLFRNLGDLRDEEVLEEWVKRLSRAGDPLRELLLAHLKAEEKEWRERALAAATSFRDKKWQQLQRVLTVRCRRVPPASPAAECLAFERFEAAREMHTRALRTEKPKPWHEARIGIKRFRYAVENLLPEHYAVWSDDLKQLQDLLGDVHDLDVLTSLVEDTAAKSMSEEAALWRDKIARERGVRLEKYRRLTVGNTGVWHKWRHGLPHGEQLASAATARLLATARTATPNLRRARCTARIAAAVWRGLRRKHGAKILEAPAFEKIFQAAATLHGVRAWKADGPARKAACKFLQGLPVPPSWSIEEWETLAAAVRYHRGPEPSEGAALFSRLSSEERELAAPIAGLLRLARALRKCGITKSKGIRIEKSADALVIHVPDLPDSEAAAVRLAAGKHMLEIRLGTPLLLKPAKPPEHPSDKPADAEPQSSLFELAAASD